MRWHVKLACLAVVLIASGCSRKAADYLERGNKLFGAGKYQDAALQYRNAIQKDPNAGEAYYRLGLADEREAQGAEALQALTKAVALMPQNEEAMAKLGDLCFDGYVYSPRRPKGLYDTAKDPDNDEAVTARATLLMQSGKPE